MRLAAKAAEVRKRNPAIAKREAAVTHYREIAPEIICPTCEGMALTPRACQSCEGFGFVCPRCRGMRWIKGMYGPQRCTRCCDSAGRFDPDRESNAINNALELAKRKAAA